jgi:hypothetical protein
MIIAKFDQLSARVPFDKSEGVAYAAMKRKRHAHRMDRKMSSPERAKGGRAHALAKPARVAHTGILDSQTVRYPPYMPGWYCFSVWACSCGG